MIGNIDFSLFSSPTMAYGNVVGELNVADGIRKGDEVLVLKPQARSWFSGRLKVRSVRLPESQGSLVIELEDVVAPSEADAAGLAHELTELGLFVDQYNIR